MCAGKPGSKIKWACGQCMPCRVNNRRIWVTRLVLESSQHPRTWFVTLTYRPENLPTHGTLVPKHLQDWLKRIRRHLEPDLLRFYAVGEYGSKTKRPHYHALLFTPDRADIPKLVEETWPHGFVDCSLAESAAITYVAGYTLKKMTSDFRNMNPELVPEFARMSRNPGIGAQSVPELSKALNTSAVAAEIARRGDVPSEVRIAGSVMPIGRYLRLRLRAASGYPETDPGYRLSALLSQRLETTEERNNRRRKHLATARNQYRNKAQRNRV